MVDYAGPALGMVETRGLIAAIEAADAMAKAAEVSLIAIEKVTAALVTVHIKGEVAAVRSAVDAGVAAAGRVGEVVSSHVIARPASEVSDLINKESGSHAPASSQTLEDMTVNELRSRARQVSDFPIQGRDIAKANKAELLRYFQDLG